MRKKFVFHLGHSAGFYSEFNNMVLAILYCQYNGIEFQLYSADANFGKSKGWDDYFIPFCHETRSSIHHYINNRFTKPTGRKRRILLAFYKMLHPNTYLTYELWDKIRHMDEGHSLEEIRLRCSEIIKRIYSFNDETLREIEVIKQSITIDGTYVSMHVRRGDKVCEHCNVDLSKYVSAMEGTWDRVYVMSDDYEIVKAAKLAMPNSSIFTLTAPDAAGYDHASYMRQDAKQKSNKLISLLAEMEILAGAEKIICTFSSNLGMFIGMREIGKTVGVDYKDWLIW